MAMLKVENLSINTDQLKLLKMLALRLMKVKL